MQFHRSWLQQHGRCSPAGTVPAGAVHAEPAAPVAAQQAHRRRARLRQHRFRRQGRAHQRAGQQQGRCCRRAKLAKQPLQRGARRGFRAAGPVGRRAVVEHADEAGCAPHVWVVWYRKASPAMAADPAAPLHGDGWRPPGSYRRWGLCAAAHCCWRIAVAGARRRIACMRANARA